MMKKTFSFRRFFLLLPAAGLLFLAACKTEPDDLPDDPHVTLINPFTGVWIAEGEYWQFRTDGTGGKAVTEAGPFDNDFSFFVYAGQDVQTVPATGWLVIFDDDNVTLYDFDFFHNENQVSLDSGPGPDMELERISGSPQALSLNNPLIGEWSADWSWSGGGAGHSDGTWSLKYRSDGTVKTYHHQVEIAGHQFENAYALRGDTLVIYGLMRFSNAPVIARITTMENGTLRVTETQLSPAPAVWTYTKVAAAEWR